MMSSGHDDNCQQMWMKMHRVYFFRSRKTVKTLCLPVVVAVVSRALGEPDHLSKVLLLAKGCR